MAMSNVSWNAMTRFGNSIPGGDSKMAIKPVLIGTGMPNPKHTDTAQARETNGSPIRAFGVALRLSGAIPVAFFLAIESRTSTRPVFQRCDRRKFLTIRASKKVAEFGDDFTDARKRSKSDFL
jgi:hypothetical protein